MHGVGAEFTKYDRSGSPHDRWVYATPDLRYVCYLSSFGGAGVAGGASKEQMIPVSEITQVVSGMETEAFERQISPTEKAKFEKRCFSLIAQNGTLDIQATREIKCKRFYEAFKFLLY